MDVTFANDGVPTGSIEGPSVDLTAVKAEFGRSRIRRWFGRDWAPFAE